MTDTCPSPDIAAKLARLAELESLMSSVRHDIRGMLSPMLMLSDRLAMHADPKVVKSATTLITSIQRIDKVLLETRPAQSGSRLG